MRSNPQEKQLTLLEDLPGVLTVDKQETSRRHHLIASSTSMQPTGIVT
jgi:hypothetical protein